ncbi:MAG: alpha-L-fucosidase [Tannerella sp.]|jgi:alpha-L-fucosidase|nr:alpha-L-fucosidase [Tannerella sp.]
MNRTVLIYLLLICFTASAYGQQNDVELPEAPKQYRRPSGIDPGDQYDPATFRYPYSLSGMKEKFSDKLLQDAAKEYKRVGEVIDRGQWKPNWESLAQHQTPEWFSDIKFGMFIDWGLWSVAGYAMLMGEKEIYPDWYEYQMVADNDGPRLYDKHGQIFTLRPYHEKNWGKDFARGDFIHLFTAEDYKPEKLVDLAVEAGMKYIIPFCKHFSGWCIWPSSYTHMDVGERLGQDLIRPLVDRCNEKGLKFGFYYGTQEWEYPIIADNGEMVVRQWFRKNYKNPAAPYTPDLENLIPGKIAVRDFLKDYLIPQAVEFIDRYDPDIVWYDGDWQDPIEDLGSYEISAYFYNQAQGRKDVAVNDRYGLRPDKRIARARLGDVFTSEHHSLPPNKMNGDHAWEENRGISHSFGFNWQDTDDNIMSSKGFVDMFVDIVANGGNLLLVVNLDGQGALPEMQEKRLKDIGKWLKVNGEGIYYTRPYAVPSEGNIRYTRSKDGKTVFAISLEWPGKQLQLKSVEPVKGSKIYMLGYKDPLKWSYKDGTTTIALPSKLQTETNRPCNYAYTFKIRK